ncbi:hypothetical protein GJ496_010948 [Pomphorhynchus laevis]|nr:hypothetical protein GJ496_010948 [Pomphorhynchus laevis]
MSQSSQRSIMSYFGSSSSQQTEIDRDHSQFDSTSSQSTKSPHYSSQKTERKRKRFADDSLNSSNTSRSSCCSTLVDHFHNEKENNTSVGSLNDSSLSVTSNSLETSFIGERNINDFDHYEYDFLKPDIIRDEMLRLKSDENYDSSTLHVPKRFLNEQSPAMKLWWKMKSKHFDTLLFFKVGKFYELYHMDAVIVVQELEIAFMRGSIAHCGFPEQAGSKFIYQLAKKNYKITRIEQMETPCELANRLAIQPKGFKDDKIVRREICEIITPGTCFFPSDEDYIIGIDSSSISCNNSAGRDADNFLFCLLTRSEKLDEEIGFAACNVYNGILMFGCIPNDRYSLQTLFTRCPARHILVRKQSIFCQFLPVTNDCFVEYIHCDKLEESRRVLNPIHIESLFNGSFPPKFVDIFNISRGNNRIYAKQESHQAMLDAFAYLLYYLQICKIDRSILSRRNIIFYNGKFSNASKLFMHIDGIAMRSLGVTGLGDNSLESVIDFCCTKPGKRLLRQWLMQPSCDLDTIRERVEIVESFSNSAYGFEELRTKLKAIPDLERSLMCIHMMSPNAKGIDHPDMRAIMCQEEAISKVRIRNFIKAVSELELAIEAIKIGSKFIIDNNSEYQNIAKDIIDVIDGKSSAVIKTFKDSINYDSLVTGGKISPINDQLTKYSKIVGEIKDIENDLELYRLEQCKRLKHDKVVYVESGRNRYHLEIPSHLCKSSLPNSYKITQSKKSSNIYITSYIEDMLRLLSAKEAGRDTFESDCVREMFATFDIKYPLWNKISKCLATIDVLQSMARWKDNLLISCRPQILVQSTDLENEEQTPFIEIEHGLHPLLCLRDPDFIPNDIYLSGQRIMLITGPNMGGKSTLLRQVGLIVLLAQVGMHVPARSVRFTICDRIMTRIGSYDRPAKGQSTFHVELSEMQHILSNASRNSLALIDEFGRGTSIEDGQAMSKAVLNYITKKLQCRTIFSTHFHYLLTDSSLCNKVQLSYMDFEKQSDDNIAFMYKLRKGICNNSHGLVVARMANLPEEILIMAETKSKLLEDECSALCLFRKMCECKTDNDLLNLITN